MQLALETSTDICSVAFRDAKEGVFEKREEARGSHSEKLFLFIDELRQEHGFEIAELDSVIVSEGPGSYTGLRISASAVKGLLFGTGVILYAANTLASFAAGACEEDSNIHIIHSIIDARRVHVYHQQFVCRSGRLATNDSVEVMPIEKFEKLLNSGEAVVGTGLERIDQEVLKKANVIDSSCISARSLFKLFDMDAERELIHNVDPQQFDPKYYSSNQS